MHGQLYIAVILSFISLWKNLYAIMFPIKRVDYIKKYLKLRRVYNSRKENKGMVNKFVNTYLKFDGFYVLRVAGHNGTEILVSQLIEKLYTKFKNTYLIRKRQNGE